MTTHTAFPSNSTVTEVQGATVLVLDDERCISELLTEMLQILGFTPTACNSPAAALELLSRQEFDVILTDFRMPQMNGDEFYRRAVAANPSLSSRIVFLTGDTVSEESQRFLGGAVIRYLSKPFDIASVQQVIADIVSEHAAA
jgi:CheY-like chemotaxis protein